MNNIDYEEDYVEIDWPGMWKGDVAEVKQYLVQLKCSECELVMDVISLYKIKKWIKSCPCGKGNLVWKAEEQKKEAGNCKDLWD